MKARHVLNGFNLIFMFVVVFATSGASLASPSGPYHLSQDGTTVAGTNNTPSGGVEAFILKNGVTTLLGDFGGDFSYAEEISAEGSVIVGGSELGGYIGHAFRWVDGTMTDLGTLGGDFSYANGVSADGAVVVGTSHNGVNAHAFRWVDGTMTDLGALSSGHSSAVAVSSDGLVVIGHSDVGSDPHSFRWVDGTLSDLGTLGGEYAVVSALSADGAVVVGDSNISSGGGARAFRWVDGTMSNLGTLGGNFSSAYGVSADGTVVIGEATLDNGNYHAFRWVDATMTDLGTLGGEYSNAKAISADGTTIVGRSNAEAGGNFQAFRWDETANMQSISDWLGDDVSLDGWRLETAYGVSEDGSVLVGEGFDPDDNYANWMARKGTTPDSNTGSALIDPVKWLNTVSGARQVFHTGAQLNSLALYGAHHRPLMSYDQIGDGLGFWVTGDLAKFYDDLDLVSGSAEVGMYSDYAAGRLRAGLGLGYSGQRQDLPLTGSSDLDGGYLVGELNWRPALDANLITSVTAIYGAWDAEVNRGYLNGSAVDCSTGNTDVQSAAVRLKIDWQDAFRLGPVSFDPYAGLTFTHTSVGSYTETGGSVPAKFDAQKHDAQELRIGVAGVTSLSEAIRLRLTVEGIERFDDRGPALSGQDIGGFGISFDVPGEDIRRNWARGGVDVDYTINDSSMIATSMNFANQGQDPDISGAVSYRMSF